MNICYRYIYIHTVNTYIYIYISIDVPPPKKKHGGRFSHPSVFVGDFCFLQVTLWDGEGFYMLPRP